jgi:hypothetical protein
MSARNNGGVTIRDAYSRCYGAPAAYACAVTSHNNRRSDAGRRFKKVRAEFFARRLRGNATYNNSGAVFPVLRGPCRGIISVVVQKSTRSTTEYENKE